MTDGIFAFRVDVSFKVMIPPMIKRIPKLTPAGNFSFRNTAAIIAVKAGPVDMMDDDIDGPMRSRLMK